MLAYKDGERVRLVSRSARDHTRHFADLVAAVATLSASPLVLDSEVAIYDRQFRSRFDWLREPDPDAVTSPLVYPVVVSDQGLIALVGRAVDHHWALVVLERSPRRA